MQDKFDNILQKYWGYAGFRGIQREIIESISSGRDTLGLMPTGGGKSITFQVPALAMTGVCIVITPLIALMKDQVMNLRRRNIAAAAIHTGLTHDEILATLENCVFGAVKILYVSPERLSSELFCTKLRHIKVSFVTVDEAHCISQWGYDFRPSYLRIADIRAMLPGVPVLALTATATPAVVDDIQDKLGFGSHNVFRMSFERKNLAYVVRRSADKEAEALHILQRVDGPAIVYVRSRAKAKEVAEYLAGQGISATYYHAGLDNADKDARQKAWVSDKARVMVATNAFGMGIDKPDVRTVIHTDCPDSLEAYFQEAGRAGRDGAKAYAVLLYNGADSRKLAKRIDDNFPEKEYIRKVYEHLAYFFQVAEGYGENITFEFNIEKFCHTFKHFPLRVNSALKILDRAGYIDYAEEQDNAARVMMTVTRDELYRLTNNTPNEDKVIITLLRSYGGLFSDFRFIDEGIVAQRAGLMQPQVHEALKALGRKRVLKFIPRRATPVVRYRRRREDPARLVFPKDAYEERRRQFAERIGAMMRYATNDDKCRSLQLLGYFGEDTAQPCGHCDVCLDSKGNPADTAGAEEVRAAIERLLGDGMRHHITELLGIKQPPETVDATLRRLIEEEHIYQEDGFIYKGH
ncbi:RecQ family ATP-dependent DNA helicase [Marseilla massiliensis]|uniref:ATP-dependent DNA helicase RecQ n=1 Tax=Marseilla massiliensis TaxID=1841864 RepID=A0A939B5Q5_9BACT|nr:ATP-dependent DNA helicase RecQ [Marseilla massiliensis]MBM6662337.1 RecQ family ATP-dependent DNA helicase [Marseilla massiliensis]